MRCPYRCDPRCDAGIEVAFSLASASPQGAAGLVCRWAVAWHGDTTRRAHGRRKAPVSFAGRLAIGWRPDDRAIVVELYGLHGGATTCRAVRLHGLVRLFPGRKDAVVTRHRRMGEPAAGLGDRDSETVSLTARHEAKWPRAAI